jgi:hypothetical protein
MTEATRSVFVTFVVLALFLAACGLATLHHHSDESDDLECPACLWTQVAGALQVSEAPVITAMEPVACISLETDEGVLPREAPGIIPPRSPPTSLS